jgi:hypothetical protein
MSGFLSPAAAKMSTTPSETIAFEAARHRVAHAFERALESRQPPEQGVVARVGRVGILLGQPLVEPALRIGERGREGDAQGAKARGGDGDEQGLDRHARAGKVRDALRDQVASRQVLEVHSLDSSSGSPASPPRLGQGHEPRPQELLVPRHQPRAMDEAGGGDQLVRRVRAHVQPGARLRDLRRNRPDVDGGQHPHHVRVIEVDLDPPQLRELGDLPTDDCGDAPRVCTQELRC